MLKSATAFGRTGLQDWLLQRISAVVLAIYVIFLVGFLLAHPIKDQIAWRSLFAIGAFKFATFVALVALLIHAWIGIWTVITDYLKNLWVRLILEIFIAIILLLYLVWGIQILWR